MIGDNQQTWLYAKVYPTGTYAFDWCTTSEKNHDFLTLYVDGVKVDAISGSSSDWITKEIPLAGDGGHTIIWIYSKDGSNSLGADRGRLCNMGMK